MKKCPSQKSLSQCHEIEDSALMPEQTPQEDNQISDPEPTDVVTGYNVKEESVLNNHTSDKSVSSRALTPAKDLNPNQIKVGDIVGFDGRIGVNLVSDSGEVLKVDAIDGGSLKGDKQ